MAHAMTKSTRRSRPAPGLCSGVCPFMLGTVVGSVTRGVCVAAVRGCCGGGGVGWKLPVCADDEVDAASAAAFFASAALAFFSSLILFLHFSATCPNFPQCEHLFSSVLCSQNLELWSFCFTMFTMYLFSTLFSFMIFPTTFPTGVGGFVLGM